MTTPVSRGHGRWLEIFDFGDYDNSARTSRIQETALSADSLAATCRFHYFAISFGVINSPFAVLN